ncbi:PREDICTED: progestin and adipoQ receptor family member 6 [Gekko japonicus]|uniref:Progestin and adipoQ receptor family member 6 n=1 Tax=Gekko japonicus TaxID=146911 RepID=A0ABM1JXU8_GEKJA|nr:PREDICTED: progestin and adipoQ receptor family member 6 [Gekko japonicus]
MLTIKLPQIFRIHQVPRIFWEDGIISGYRHPKSSALDCILSSFQMNNETINIWTHFLPTWGLLLALFQGSTGTGTVENHVESLPLTACVCLFIGCAFTYGAYTMPDRWVNGPLHHYFVPVAAFNSFVCTSLSCYSRFLELECPPLSKILRTVAFVYPFIFDNIPLFYRLFFCFGEDCPWNDAIAGYSYHLFFALLTGFLFASHLPERLAPGRFDYIGHSHQLFHICAVVGTHFQLEAVLCDLHLRRDWLSTHAPASTFTHTFATLSTALLGNLVLIAFFTVTLFRSSVSTTILQSTLSEVERHKDK